MGMATRSNLARLARHWIDNNPTRIHPGLVNFLSLRGPLCGRPTRRLSVRGTCACTESLHFLITLKIFLGECERAPPSVPYSTAHAELKREHQVRVLVLASREANARRFTHEYSHSTVSSTRMFEHLHAVGLLLAGASNAA